jgi:hypothetical protein
MSCVMLFHHSGVQFFARRVAEGVVSVVSDRFIEPLWEDCCETVGRSKECSDADQAGTGQPNWGEPLLS